MVDFEGVLRAHGMILSVDFDKLKHRLTEIPKDASNINLYKNLRDLITPKFENLET